MSESIELERLLAIMRALRDPEHGCAWDRQQTHQSLARYAIEEAYEVADAAQRGSDVELRDELGDLLLQVVFHAQLASERGAFDFADVVTAISDKMTRRHPHVFDPACAGMTPEQVSQAWEAIKTAERAVRGEHGMLADVSTAQPAMLRAHKIQQRLAGVGYDWSDVAAVVAALQDEVAELQQALTDADQDAVEEELGDVLFSCVNVARKLRSDAELLLHRASDKISARVAWIEQRAAINGVPLSDMDVGALDDYWQQAKQALQLLTEDD